MPIATSRPTLASVLLDRRRFLAIAAGATGAAALAACRSSSDPTSAPPRSSSPSTAAGAKSGPATTPYRLDPETPYWLQGNYAPVPDELDVTDLVVDGTIPTTLQGLYVRNGSNPATGTSPHWFLGDGMLHGVRLEAGRAAWYRNRYVRTPAFEQGREFGDLAGGAPGAANGQSNVSIVALGRRLLSCGEVGWPYEIDPRDLSTLGAVDLAGPAGGLGANFTAHPKIDPDTGEMHAFGYGFVPPYLTYYRVGADGSLLAAEDIEVAGPTMMHDFAITDRDVVFWELPVVFHLDAAIDGTGFPFVWTPDYGSRLGVMPLGGSAAEMRWVEIPNQMVFHGTNAFRDGDDIVVDVCRQDSAFDPAGDPPGSTLHRWRVGTSGDALTFSDEQLDDRWMDLPRIDPARTGRTHDRGWYVDYTDNPDEGLLFRGVTGVASGVVDARWEPHDAEHAGEVTFVPDETRGAGAGWLLTFVHDRRTDSSALAVLDPEDLASGPVGRIRMPRRVPFGFHGTWLPDMT